MKSKDIFKIDENIRYHTDDIYNNWNIEESSLLLIINWSKIHGHWVWGTLKY